MGKNSCRTGSGKNGKVKALRRHGCPVRRAMSYLCHAQNRPKSRPPKNAQELHVRVLFFAVLSRFIAEIERATTLGFENGFSVSRI
jgi:hypothetical protein